MRLLLTERFLQCYKAHTVFLAGGSTVQENALAFTTKSNIEKPAMAKSGTFKTVLT